MTKQERHIRALTGLGLLIAYGITDDKTYQRACYRLFNETINCKVGNNQKQESDKANINDHPVSLEPVYLFRLFGFGFVLCGFTVKESAGDNGDYFYPVDSFQKSKKTFIGFLFLIGFLFGVITGVVVSCFHN